MFPFSYIADGLALPLLALPIYIFTYLFTYFLFIYLFITLVYFRPLVMFSSKNVTATVCYGSQATNQVLRQQFGNMNMEA